MSDDPDYILDLNGQPSANDSPSQPFPKPWIGIQFECCGIYVRIYRNREGTAYVGRCPRCLAKTEIRIGPSGSATRLFRAS